MVSAEQSSPVQPDGSWGGVLTDDGGRPVTDDGGRPVYASPTDDGEPYVLDAAGTPPVGEPTATGTDSPPVTTSDPAVEVVEDETPAPGGDTAPEDPPPAEDQGA